MSLIKWFDDRKKQAQGLYHQVNPFDGGRTYDTNQRGVNPGTPNPVRIDDNTPGFQWSNNSLTRGLSRGFDQVNPLDNNRTWQQRTPTDTLSLVQEAKQKLNTPNRPAQYWDNGIGKAVNTGLAATMRAAAGVGQDAGGLYDLLTPGHGTSRFTDYWKNRGAMWDERAKEAGVHGAGYHVAQVPLNIAAFAAPGQVAKGVGAIPKVANATNAVSNVINKAPGVAKAAGYVDDLAASGNRLQRVGGKMLQSYRQPGAQIDIAFDALQNAGHRTSLGQDNSLGTAAIDAGLSLGMQGGVNLLGQGLQAGAAPVIRSLRNNNLIRPTNLTPDELFAAAKVRSARQGYSSTMDLTDVDMQLYTQAQAKLGATPYSPAGTKAIDDALGAHQTYEVAKQQRRQSIQEAIERLRSPRPLGEDGFVRIPGSNDYPDLSPQQREFINDYANMLEGMGAGNGVDITPDGRRISSNFRDADTAGRTMTKRDWFEKARKDIESGKAGFGASDDYKKLPGVKSDPLESLKQEARKYKSVEEFVKAIQDGKVKTTVDNADLVKQFQKDYGIDFDKAYKSKDPKALENMQRSAVERLYKESAQPTKSLVKTDDLKLYHGTRTGNKFDKWDSSKAATGVGGGGLGNGANQGNIAYFTTSPDSAKIFSKSANESYMLRNSKNIEDLSKVADQPAGEVLEFGVSKNAKIIELDHAPDTKEIAQLKEQGYDGARFDDKDAWTGFSEGRWTLPKDTTTVAVWNTDKVTGKSLTKPTKGANTSPKANSARATGQSQPAGIEPQTQPSSRRSSTPSQVQNTPQGQPAVSSRQSVQSSSSLDASGATSSKAPIIADNSTTSATKNLPESEWGRLLRQADEELPTFEAVAGAQGTRNADRLADAINTDNKITKAAREAQRTGKELHFYAKNDANGRSVGIEQFDPKAHRIEAGFVVDQNGNVVGNHIKVDETGIQVNVGGDLINMSRVIGSPDSWRGKYRVTETMSRNIDRNAPNKQVAQQAKDFIVGSKVKAEANYRVELEGEFKKLGERIKQTNKAKPRGVSKKQWQEDIFDSLDGKLSDADISAKYGDKAQAILNYKKQTRELYDSLFERINAERVKFGQAPIEKRQDYITHLQELSGNRSFTGEVYNSIRNSFTDEGMQKTRGGVPGDIAGRTENFQPRSAYNRFLQRRTGDKAVKDPFAAVQAYLEPALYNIHMTEATVRARAVEAAFRTAGQLKNMSAEGANKRLNGLLNAYKGGDNGKLVAGFQEYANALAKKTHRWDRQVIDTSDATATALKGWQGLQRIGGRATILGNVSSTMAQPLNQVITLADAGPVNYMKGVAAALSGDKAIQKSSFIRARATKAVAPIRSKGQRVLDAGGVPLEVVEMASVRNTWHTMHAKAKAAGKQGMEAIKQADYDTERLVAGRGIADRPEAYRSTISNGLLQYTLEVSAQNKAFWNDLSVSQKATFLVAAAGVNSMYGAITGFEPLPDFLGAALDTGKDFVNPEDDRSAGEKVVGGAQRMAGEAVSMNPMYSAAANMLLSQDQRRGLFGSESDLGRFEGTSAPVQVVRNWNRARESAMDGNFTDARNSILRTVPFGNQARKTLTGAEANAAGHAVDRSGKKTFETGRNAVEKSKNLLFGPSSTSGDYYDRKKDSSKSTKTVDGKTIKVEKRGESALEGIKSSFGGKYAKLTADELKTLAETDEDAKAYQTNLKAVKQAIKKPNDLPENLNKYAKKVYETQARLTPEGKDKWKKRSADKVVKDTLSSWLPKGIERPPVNNEIAVEWANYEKKKAEGTLGKLEDESDRKSILRKAYNSQLNEDERDLYKLSEANLKDAYDRGLISDSNIEKALKVEKQLFDAGLISKETLRKKLGLSARGYKAKGRGGRKASGLSLFDMAAKANAYIKPPSLDAPQIRKAPTAPQVAIKRKISGSTAAPKVSIRKGTRLA